MVNFYLEPNVPLKAPLITVCIPSYNHLNWIDQAIGSVASQTYDNIELIVIDDGSTDGTREMLSERVPEFEARFAHFTYIEQPNSGLCATLNRALKLGRGTYFSTLASDDAFLPNKLSDLIGYLEHNPDCAAASGGFQYISASGTPIGTRKFRPAKLDFEDILLSRSSFPAPSAMIRTNVLKEIGGYSPRWLLEDWPTWLAMAKTGRTLDLLSGTFALYRRHPHNLSRNTSAIHQDRLAIIQKYSPPDLRDRALLRAEEIRFLDLSTVDKAEALRTLPRLLRPPMSWATLKGIVKLVLPPPKFG